MGYSLGLAFGFGAFLCIGMDCIALDEIEEVVRTIGSFFTSRWFPNKADAWRGPTYQHLADPTKAFIMTMMMMTAMMVVSQQTMQLIDINNGLV